jgi:hypothetical protein
MSFKVANPVQDFTKGLPIILGYVSSSSKQITLPSVFHDLRAACIERNFTTEEPTVVSVYHREIQWKRIDVVLPESSSKRIIKGCLMGVAAVATFCFLRCCFYYLYQVSWRSFNPYYDVLNLVMTGLFLKAMHWITAPSYYQLIQPVTMSNSSLLEAGLTNLANSKTPDEKFEDPITFDESTKEQIIRPRNIAFGRYAIRLDEGVEAMLRSNLGQRIPHPCESRLCTIIEQEQIARDLCAFFSIQDPQQFIDCWNIDFGQEFRRQIPFYDQLTPDEKSQIKIDTKTMTIRQNRKFLALLPSAITTKYFRKLETTDPAPIEVQVAKDLRESLRYKQLERQYRQ